MWTALGGSFRYSCSSCPMKSRQASRMASWPDGFSQFRSIARSSLHFFLMTPQQMNVFHRIPRIILFTYRSIRPCVQATQRTRRQEVERYELFNAPLCRTSDISTPEDSFGFSFCNMKEFIVKKMTFPPVRYTSFPRRKNSTDNIDLTGVNHTIHNVAAQTFSEMPQNFQTGPRLCRNEFSLSMRQQQSLTS
jgi:hypothetical protein